MLKRTEACRGGVSPLGAVLPPALYAGADITGGFPMIYNSDTLEREALLDCARRMCAAARTAPKAKGIDNIVTLVLTGEDKDRVADEMERLAEPLQYKFFLRDAGNIRDAGALVLLGIREGQRGLNDGCGHCHFDNCADCALHHGVCVYDPMDLGIAIGSAVAIAADCRVDNRVLFSAGRAAMEMNLMGADVKMVMGIPLAIAGKSPFFDRKPKK